MRISHFGVRNYRSITATQKLPLQRLTALVGKNNEGKSNILRSLVLAMQILTGDRGSAAMSRRRPLPRYLGGGDPRIFFDWERDFPKDFQGTQRTTAFDLVFELSDAELEAFRDEVGSSLNTELPIRIVIAGNREPSISIRKPGRGHKTLNAKSAKITDFIRRRVRVQYVPTIRTAEHAMEIVDTMVSQALARVESTEAFRDAMAAVERVQAPVLESLSTEVAGVLRDFLPDIQSASIGIERDDRYRALRRIASVLINDGSETDLRVKGDGVQSLVALALMRQAAQEAAEDDMNLVLAIEEPEAHLHPSAAHQLRALLEGIALEQQVILTTHSPLFVIRNEPRANIVVSDNEGRTARNMAQIRDLLGVRLADNLQSARLILLVEGQSDAIILKSLVARASSALRQALSTHEFAVESLGGASKLEAHVAMFRSAAASTVAFLDDDDEGRKSAQRAKERGLLLDADCLHTTKRGFPEAEIEDLLDACVYREALEAQWNVSLTGSEWHSNRKWSNRMAAVFTRDGQPWSDTIAQRVKLQVAELAAARAADAIHEASMGPINALIRTVERKVGGQNAASSSGVPQPENID